MFKRYIPGITQKHIFPFNSLFLVVISIQVPKYSHFQNVGGMSEEIREIQFLKRLKMPITWAQLRQIWFKLASCKKGTIGVVKWNTVY